jgi:hypothetical protein
VMCFPFSSFSADSWFRTLCMLTKHMLYHRGSLSTTSLRPAVIFLVS